MRITVINPARDDARDALPGRVIDAPEAAPARELQAP
jgi:hypothetical protein